MNQRPRSIFRDPSSELDDSWVHGVLIGGMASEPDDVQLARAYAAAAGQLIDQAIKGSEEWRSAYPIMYLYRHALELYLKAASPSSPPRHQLEPLISAFEKLTEDRLGGALPSELLADLRIFASIDSDAQGFRYVRRLTGEARFLPGEYWVALVALRSFFEELFGIVEEVIRVPG